MINYHFLVLETSYVDLGANTKKELTIPPKDSVMLTMGNSS